MALINPHINFNGNCEEAFTFYKSVFGGEFTKVIRFRDMAHLGDMATGAEADKMMHLALPIGGNTLIGNDVPEMMGPVNERENRSKISVSAASREEASRLFSGLSAGGDVEVPDGDDTSGAYFAMFRDKYGIEWIVEFAQEG